MFYIIRTLPRLGDQPEAPTYWVPGPNGYTRTGNVAEARARAWTTREEALAYLQRYVTGVAQDAVIEVE